MCRWLAYSGSPLRLDYLLLNRDRSLVDQSLHSQLGATTTNGDGFGIGWYDGGPQPHLYRSVHPAWNDRNLKELAASISSPLFFSHIRASTGTAIQETNTHPFRHGKWLWMHNGAIRGYETVVRELRFAVDPSLYPSIEGTTDSETMFYLALTFGLEDDPPGAVERMVGFVEETGTRPRRRAPDPDDGRDVGRAEAVGVPLLERRRLAVALLQHADRRAARALSGRARAGAALGRVQGRPVGAARRPAGRLERGSRVELGRRPGGRRTSCTRSRPTRP